jgi:hypothetical protein
MGAARESRLEAILLPVGIAETGGKVVLNLVELLLSPVCILPDPELSPVLVGNRLASSSSIEGKLCLNSSSSSGAGCWGTDGRL